MSFTALRITAQKSFIALIPDVVPSFRPQTTAGWPPSRSTEALIVLKKLDQKPSDTHSRRSIMGLVKKL